MTGGLADRIREAVNATKLVMFVEDVMALNYQVKDHKSPPPQRTEKRLSGGSWPAKLWSTSCSGHKAG